jgi:hypothetical protein
MAVTVLIALLLITAPVAHAQEGDFSSPDDCASCHADEYRVWQESDHSMAQTDPLFIEAWTRAGEPAYCGSCHATGYDAVAGTVDYEGVGCLACHDFSQETGAPHMTTDTSAERCGTCHTGTHAPDYDEWLVSGHASMNITCLDCHLSHAVDLRIEDPTELCSSCHEMDAEGSLHGQEGMACHDCHMHRGDEVVDPLSQRRKGPGHTFTIPSDVCASCHGMTHTLTDDGSPQESVADIQRMLDTCEAEGTERASNQMNIGLTGGGLGGLIVGITIPYLLQRRRGMK